MRSALLPLALLALSACLPTPGAFAQSFAPGIQEDSHVHAWQAASFAYAFLDGHETQWQARLAAAPERPSTTCAPPLRTRSGC